MASAPEKDDERKTLTLSCITCKDDTKTPKLLPCQHSFCTKCLVQHKDTLDEGAPLCCPKCHKNIELGGDTVDRLPDNYVYDIVREAYGRFTSSEMKCISCKQIEKMTNATHKCLDCGDTLCQQCNDYHCRFTMARNHVVVPLEELKKGHFKEELSKRKTLYCDVHSTNEHNLPLSSYCSNCECLVCVMCIQGDHTRHAVTNPHDAKEKRQVTLKSDFIKLQQSEKDQQKRIKNIENCISNTKQTWNEQEAEIYDKATEIYAMVDKVKEEKLAELKARYQEELKRLNNLLEEEKFAKNRIEASSALTREFLEHSSESDFLYHEKDIKSRMGSSQRRDSHVYMRNVLSVEKDDGEALVLMIGKVFGTMVSKTLIEHYKGRIGKEKEIFSREVNIDQINGIACNVDTKELFLVGQNSKALTVLDNCGMLQRNMNFGCSFHDISLNSSRIFATVYSPKGSRKLVTCDLDKQGEQYFMLPNEDQKTDYCMFVAEGDNTVYLASHAIDRVYRILPGEDKLSVFLSKENGSKLSGITFLCAVPSGGLAISNDIASNIQVYSQHGDLLWQYNGHENGSPLDIPSGICCDNDGYIYVVDIKNCRIQVIREKEWIGNIPIHKGVKDWEFVPLVLTLDGDLVYGYGNKLVKISFWE